MLSGSDDGFGGGLSCPEKDRSLMMGVVRTSETSVDNHFTRQYNPEDSSEHHNRRRENLKPHNWLMLFEEINTVDSEKHTKPINTKCMGIDCNK
jgi:hypothetical protein